MNESKRYTAFISYKHDPNDRAHALDLEKHLKTYALHPWGIRGRSLFLNLIDNDARKHLEKERYKICKDVVSKLPRLP